MFIGIADYNTRIAEIIIVHGPPGSGKSTQCERLSRSPLDGRQVIHVSAGTRLRDIRTGRVGSRFQTAVNDPNAPSPLDNQVVNGVIFEDIPPHPADTIALVDGYPRHLDAVDTFVEAIKEEGHRLLGCISLELSLETSISRILGRGIRDGERLYGGGTLAEFARRRYEGHINTTLRTISALGKTLPLIPVDAEPGADIVFGSFSRAAGEIAPTSLPRS